MPETPPSQSIELTWLKDLQFAGRAGDLQLTLDSAGKQGPSPTQALAFALASCMAMDVVFMLQKARQDLRGLRVVLHAWRASEHPRRFVEVQLRFLVSGNVQGEQVERAIGLSREKYCSVWNSMRQDIVFEAKYEIGAAT
jgi:putative redox protein